MRSPKRTKVYVRHLAEQAVERLREDCDDEVLGVVRQLLADQVEKPSGRPAENDWPVLKEMAKLLASGEADSVSDAARQVAHMIPDVLESTAVGRLRSNFPTNRSLLEAELAAEEAAASSRDGIPDDQEDDIIKKAFEEDFEVWDF